MIDLHCDFKVEPLIDKGGKSLTNKSFHNYMLYMDLKPIIWVGKINHWFLWRFITFLIRKVIYYKS